MKALNLLSGKYKGIEKYSLFDIFNTIFMILLCFSTLYPFWYILVVSFNDGANSSLGGVWFWPRVFTLDNYKFVIANPLITQAYLVTIIRVLIGPAISVITCALAGYAMSQKELKGKKILVFYFMMPMFIGGTLISHYLVMTKIGLYDNFLVYILPGVYSFFTMVVMRTFFEDLPVSLEESARLDGAGPFRILVSIVLPLSKPVLAAFMFFGLVSHWLDFSTNLIYVMDEKLTTLQYLLYKIVLESDTQTLIREALAKGQGPSDIRLREQVTPFAIQMTTLVVVTFPLLVIYPFFQKYFIKGALVGAVKE